MLLYETFSSPVNILRGSLAVCVGTHVGLHVKYVLILQNFKQNQ